MTIERNLRVKTMFPAYPSQNPNWQLQWNFDRPNLTYRIGETAVATCTFKNVGQTSIHLRRICLWFDWLPQDQAYYIDTNTVYQPNQWLWPSNFIQAAFPLNVPTGYHGFKFGVDYRYWNGSQWAEVGGIQWSEPSGPSLDQVLINYPQPRNFKVFISHSEKDIELTNLVADFIRRGGQVPYIAESPQNPDLGKKMWEEKIDNALRTSNALLLLWTRNSAGSSAVGYEIQRAIQLQKRIIPAVEEGLQLPSILKDRVYTKFSYLNQIEAIKSILTTLLDFEREINPQQNVMGILALIAGLAIVGKMLSD